ncbi:MAG: dihydrofolate reductase [Bacteroides sp.]|nr:dihydrofolate reductase [Bacteroides sp.]MCM1413009.1 dihydrofolate reductase [Bacteroides sp.]MCM1471715.1 dihydrofolate reductase [Bacteroides sp.]
MKVSIIAIVARNGAIGVGGDQPFHISADFKRFKTLTMGKPIVMGRRTFEALPGGALPGRRNIVVTRSADWHAEGVETAPSIETALAMARDGGTEEAMIIGGGMVYAQAMPLADRLLITEVDAMVDDADTFFPDIDPALWKLIEASDYAVDPRSGAPYRFLEFRRI